MTELVTQVNDSRIQAVIDNLRDWVEKGCVGIVYKTEDMCEHGRFRSQSELAPIFKAQTGMTPQEYLLALAGPVEKRRVVALNKVLTPTILSSDLGTSDIAKRSGIPQGLLTAACQEVFGISLVEYIQKRRQKESVRPLPEFADLEI